MDNFISDIEKRVEDMKSNMQYLTFKDDFESTSLSSLALAEYEANKNRCKDLVKIMENTGLFYKSLNQDMDSWVSLEETKEAMKQVGEELKEVNSNIDREKECIEELSGKTAWEYETLQKKLEVPTQMLQLLNEKKEKVETSKHEREATLAELGINASYSGDFQQLQQQQVKDLANTKAALQSCQTSSAQLTKNIILLKQQHQQLKQQKLLKQRSLENKSLQEQLAISKLRESKTRLRDQLDKYEDKGKLRLVSGNTTEQINMELCNNSQNKDIPRLIVSATTKTDNLLYNHVVSAEVNDKNIHADDLIKRAVHRNDLPQMFLLLEDRWKTFFPIASEMKNIADRHAVDWIKDKNLIRVLVGKGASIICTLQMPEKYPYAGEITLVNANGLPDDVKEEDISPPADKRGLQDWVDYLEDKFGKP